MPCAGSDGVAAGAAGAIAGWVGVCGGEDAGGIGAGTGAALRDSYKYFIYTFSFLGVVRLSVCCIGNVMAV